MSLAAILLASARDADGHPLALLPWDNNRTLVEYQVEQLQLAGVRDIEIVLASDAADVIPLVSADNVEPIVDAFDEPGGASALRVGASAVPRGTTTAIIVSVDEPRPAAVYARLLEAHTPDATLTRPSYEGAAAAPCIVNERMLEQLRNVRDAAMVEALLARNDATVDVPWDSDLVLLRVANADDCARLRDRLEG
jgi:CTP:molybdopterin cytidylyltransferase MocA